MTVASEGDEHGQVVGRRVGVRDAAADRPPVADLGVADQRGRLGEQAGVLPDERIASATRSWRTMAPIRTTSPSSST